jgi:hypothetical protein
MENDKIEETILSWDTMLSERMKRYLHYKSMKNFVLHFEEIKNGRDRERVLRMLSDYIEEVKENDYSFEGYSSGTLAKKYLFNLAEYYRDTSHFMRNIRIQMVFLYGLLGDSLLYLGGLLRNMWYIPIVTVCLLLYYFFITLFKVPKGRVYGLFY